MTRWKGIMLCTLVLGVGACRTVHVQAPEVEGVPAPQQVLQEKKTSLQEKKKASAPLPEVLGGIVQSDTWTIYKDKEQEEFTGHVSYDNGIYVFKAGYALADRKAQTVTARENVYIKQQNPQGPTYEGYADTAHYNYQTGKGVLKSVSKNPVRLILTEKEQTVNARAKQIAFNTQTRVFVLSGNVYATRTTPQGTQTLQADKVTLKQDENYAHLEGNAVLSDGARTLQADTVIYDGQHDDAHAYGARPLVSGTTEQGTFAIIADDVRSDAQGHVVTLQGQVQGWLVSPELNENKINRQF